MDKHARLIQPAGPALRLGQDHHGLLFDQLLAAFDTACTLEMPWIAEPLLAFMEESFGGDDLAAGIGLSRLEQLVEARFCLLEVKYQMRDRGSPAG